MIDRIKGVGKSRPVSPISPSQAPKTANDATKVDLVKTFQEDISKLMNG